MALGRAWANVASGVSPSIREGRGMSATVTRNGVGDYTLNFNDDLVANSTNYCLIGSVLGSDADLDHIDVEQVNDRSCRVRTGVDGVAGDVDFSIELWSDNDSSAAA